MHSPGVTGLIHIPQWAATCWLDNQQLYSIESKPSFLDSPIIKSYNKAQISITVAVMINRNTGWFSLCQEFLDLAEQCKATLELLCFLFFAPCTCPDQRGGENPLLVPVVPIQGSRPAWRALERPTLCYDLLRSDRAVYRWPDRKEGMIVKRMKEIKYFGLRISKLCTAGEERGELQPSGGE